MADVIGISGINKTPSGFTDQSRPKLMMEADSVMNKLAPDAKRDLSEVFDVLHATADLLRSTKNYELEDFWSKFETKLNHGRTLRTKAETGIEDLMTAFSLFYSGLNIIDQAAVSTDQLAEFKKLYEDLQPFVQTKFATPLTGKDRNVFNRIFTVTGKRLESVVESFNARVQAGEISGSQIRV